MSVQQVLFRTRLRTNDVMREPYRVYSTLSEVDREPGMQSSRAASYMKSVS